MVMMTAPAFANEQWDYHLRGLEEGLAAGLLPPPGFYFISTSIWAPSFHPYGITDNAGVYHADQANSNTKFFVFVEVPVLMWSSGCKILGADYGAAISEPLNYTSFRSQTGLTGISPLGTNFEYGSSQWGAYNTIIAPILLSWHLNPALHIGAGLAVGVNDGTSSPGDSVASNLKNAGLDLPGANKLYTNLSKYDGNIYLWSSNNCWTFAPHFGITFLYPPGWHVSADFIYAWYTKDTDTNYQSGDQFFGDYTVSYTCGKWTFGIGAESTTQIQNDKFALVNPLTGKSSGFKSQPNSQSDNYALGPLIGYDFGPCSLMFVYNFALETKNDLGGDFAYLRLVIPLGNPFPFGGK
jgi:hypothetical protein